MKAYLDTLRDIKDNGYEHPDRTGVGRKSLNGLMLKFDVSDGTIPLVTTRKLNPEAVIGETLWFIKGSKNVEELRELGVKFWDRWAVTEEDINSFIDKFLANKSDEEIKMVYDAISDDKLHSIGNIYGPNWRNSPADPNDHFNMIYPLSHYPSDKLAQYREEYIEQNTIGDQCDFNEEEFITYCSIRYHETIDQLNELVMNLRNNPYSSRLIVNAWTPAYLPNENVSPQDNVIMGKGALAPCHMFYQCFVKPPLTENGKPVLSLLVYLRSNDFPIGSPVNIGQYALLLHMLAHVTDMDPGTYIYTGGDYHIYLNQLELIDKQLEREPYPLPGVWLNPEVKDLFAFTKDDIRIEGYQSHGVINYPVSV